MKKRTYALVLVGGSVPEEDAVRHAQELAVRGKMAAVVTITDNEDGSRDTTFKLWCPPRGPEIRPKGGRG